RLIDRDRMAHLDLNVLLDDVRAPHLVGDLHLAAFAARTATSFAADLILPAALVDADLTSFGRRNHLGAAAVHLRLLAGREEIVARANHVLVLGNASHVLDGLGFRNHLVLAHLPLHGLALRHAFEVGNVASLLDLLVFGAVDLAHLRRHDV